MELWDALNAIADYTDKVGHYTIDKPGDGFGAGDDGSRCFSRAAVAAMPGFSFRSSLGDRLYKLVSSHIGNRGIINWSDSTSYGEFCATLRGWAAVERARAARLLPVVVECEHANV